MQQMMIAKDLEEVRGSDTDQNASEGVSFIKDIDDEPLRISNQGNNNEEESSDIEVIMNQPPSRQVKQRL